jgi:hypothetical protein
MIPWSATSGDKPRLRICPGVAHWHKTNSAARGVFATLRIHNA